MRALAPPEVLERAGIDPVAVKTLPWEEPTWLVDLGTERAVLSAKGGRVDGMLEWESALLDALERRSFPASRSIKLFDGEDHLRVGAAHYVVRSWIRGRTLFELGSADLSVVGRFIAAFHDATESIDLPQRPGIGELLDVLREPSDEQIATCLRDRRAPRLYEMYVDDVVPAISKRPQHSMPIHGDFTTRNIVADGAPPFITGLIDFGMAMRASPAVELAYSLGSTRPDFGAVEHRLDLVTELVGAYAEVRTLPGDEAAQIVDHARARPLLNIALRARTGRTPRSARALERVAWLTDHRDEMVAAVERGLAQQ